MDGLNGLSMGSGDRDELASFGSVAFTDPTFQCRMCVGYKLLMFLNLDLFLQLLHCIMTASGEMY